MHSQSGPFSWLIADQRPSLVKGVLAIEPNGPPFFAAKLSGDDWYRLSEHCERPYGMTHQPLTFDPPISSTDYLDIELDPKPADNGRIRGYIQKEPARQLVNLQGIPTLMLAGEASYHATYDYCTSRFLAQAGVTHDFVRLEDRGISGNGHMMLCEFNNHEIADLLLA